MLIAADKGLVSPSDRVGKFFTAPPEKENLTVWNLLTHTLGIGHKALNSKDVNYGNVHDYILGIKSDVPIGTEVLYSCPGFILLGKIAEKVFDGKLDELFYTLVAEPLGMKSSRFLPNKDSDLVNSNVSQDERGTVNDYNCRHLGGVCANAGLFSNLSDMSAYVKMLRSFGAPIISKKTFELATQNHTPNMCESRGLGFLYVDGRYLQTGGLFAKGSVGHCGHTGQSVFLDPKSGLYTIILSDATVSTVKKYGYENYEEVIAMRRDIHAAIKADLRL